MLTLDEKIASSEHFAKLCGQAEIPEWTEECEQLVTWLRILKKQNLSMMKRGGLWHAQRLMCAIPILTRQK